MITTGTLIRMFIMDQNSIESNFVILSSLDELEFIFQNKNFIQSVMVRRFTMFIGVSMNQFATYQRLVQLPK